MTEYVNPFTGEKGKSQFEQTSPVMPGQGYSSAEAGVSAAGTSETVSSAGGLQTAAERQKEAQARRDRIAQQEAEMRRKNEEARLAEMKAKEKAELARQQEMRTAEESIKKSLEGKQRASFLEQGVLIEYVKPGDVVKTKTGEIIGEGKKMSLAEQERYRQLKEKGRDEEAEKFKASKTGTFVRRIPKLEEGQEIMTSSEAYKKGLITQDELNKYGSETKLIVSTTQNVIENMSEPFTVYQDQLSSLKKSVEEKGAELKVLGKDPLNPTKIQVQISVEEGKKIPTDIEIESLEQIRQRELRTSTYDWASKKFKENPLLATAGAFLTGEGGKIAASIFGAKEGQEGYKLDLETRKIGVVDVTLPTLKRSESAGVESVEDIVTGYLYKEKLFRKKYPDIRVFGEPTKIQMQRINTGSMALKNIGGKPIEIPQITYVPREGEEFTRGGVYTGGLIRRRVEQALQSPPVEITLSYAVPIVFGKVVSGMSSILIRGGTKAIGTGSKTATISKYIKPITKRIPNISSEVIADAGKYSIIGGTSGIRLMYAKELSAQGRYTEAGGIALMTGLDIVAGLYGAAKTTKNVKRSVKLTNQFKGVDVEQPKIIIKDITLFSKKTKTGDIVTRGYAAYIIEGQKPYEGGFLMFKGLTKEILDTKINMPVYKTDILTDLISRRKIDLTETFRISGKFSTIPTDIKGDIIETITYPQFKGVRIIKPTRISGEISFTTGESILTKRTGQLGLKSFIKVRGESSDFVDDLIQTKTRGITITGKDRTGTLLAGEYAGEPLLKSDKFKSFSEDVTLYGKKFDEFEFKRIFGKEIIIPTKTKLGIDIGDKTITLDEFSKFDDEIADIIKSGKKSDVLTAKKASQIAIKEQIEDIAQNILPQKIKVVPIKKVPTTVTKIVTETIPQDTLIIPVQTSSKFEYPKGTFEHPKGTDIWSEIGKTDAEKLREIEELEYGMYVSPKAAEIVGIDEKGKTISLTGEISSTKSSTKKSSIIGQAQMNMQKIKSSQILKQKRILKSSLISEQIPSIRVEEGIISGQSTATKTITSLATINKQMPKLKKAMQYKQKLMKQAQTQTNLIAETTIQQFQTGFIPPLTYTSYSDDSDKRKKKIKEVGYIPLVKRRGKFIAVSKVPLEKGKALYLGKKTAEKTLAARFKIVKKGKARPSALPSIKEVGKKFRGYRIIKGRKVPLKDEFIQKAKYRLSTKSEVREIQEAKRASIFGKSKKRRIPRFI